MIGVEGLTAAEGCPVVLLEVAGTSGPFFASPIAVLSARTEIRIVVEDHGVRGPAPRHE